MKHLILTFAFFGLMDTASAHKRVNEILEKDVVCENLDKTLRIAQDLSQATITRKSCTRVHSEALCAIPYPVEYHYNSGGRSQILAFGIVGYDELQEETTIKDIFKLEDGVEGYRARQAGYGVRTLESFQCQYEGTK